MTGERSAVTPLRPRDPRRLGDYELVGRLGEGGMGTVYLARNPVGVLVAVKMVRADLAPDDEFRRRFRSEVTRVRQVPPFCTAEVLDADPDHEPPYLVVEYVDGPSLADVVQQRGPLTASNLHGVAIGVATALTAIHGAGVIHRDLKPRNVLLAPGSPKVIDFGIARALEATSAHTGTDQMVGTVAYMAPERFGSQPGTSLTPAADIFAWGGVVAFAGTGRTPFGADSPTATAARILTQPPDLSGLTGSLRELVGHALEKDPANRPSARELLDLLVTGPQRTAASAAALAHQPGLRAAAQEAQAATGYDANRQLTAVAVPPDLAEYVDATDATRIVTTAPPPPVPAPRRRRWPAPVVAVLVLLAVLAAAALVVSSQVWRGGSGHNNADAPAAPAPNADSKLLVSDALDHTWFWQESADAREQASCSFDGGLVVRRKTAGSFRCRGPQDAEPDHLRTDVNVRLLTKGSCAGIWFRFRPYLGYQLRVCENRFLVGTHKDADAEVYRTFPLDDPIDIGGPPTKITLNVLGDTVEVLRNDAPVGTVPLTDKDITGGRVVLGIFTEPAGPAHTPPYAVAFDHITIRALP
jgi:eukaryotic-like serine/threonine-protein kinase